MQSTVACSKLLGADHDGDNNNCKSSSNYIMTPIGGTAKEKNYKNSYKFSSCSMKKNCSDTFSECGAIKNLCNTNNFGLEMFENCKSTCNQCHLTCYERESAIFHVYKLGTYALEIFINDIIANMFKVRKTRANTIGKTSFHEEITVLGLIRCKCSIIDNVENVTI
ncbi:hypothetical protein A3Q56_05984 [Intoshia linei]|uniref:ShKT domain-containing protein n=1 Tax=Intoshia linei TaxID=1819745 RepID=A0A177AWD0_9BILA|nr:hypothetical protein A3Q56_05984 [Intoshia linei]